MSRILVRLALSIALVGIACTPSLAWAESGDVQLVAEINSVGFDGKHAFQDVPLHPEKVTSVALQITNNGSKSVTVRQAELRGGILGLALFDYIAAIDAVVAPGSTQVVQYQFAIGQLEDQATGLIPAQVILTDATGAQVAALDLVADVKGSFWSVYGLFGLAMGLLTALAIADICVALVRRTMPDNRFLRGLRTLLPGLGLGLVCVFTASVARWWAPQTGHWLAIAAGVGLVSFALGYFAPSHDEEDVALDLDELEKLDLSLSHRP